MKYGKVHIYQEVFTIGKTTAPGQVRFAGAVPAFMKDSLASTLDNKSILDPKI